MRPKSPLTIIDRCSRKDLYGLYFRRVCDEASDTDLRQMHCKQLVKEVKQAYRDFLFETIKTDLEENPFE